MAVEGEHASVSWRGAFAVTLAMAMGISPFAVFALSALAPVVVPELALSRTQLGSVATVTFAVAAAASALGGREVDLLGGRVVLSWVFATAAAASGAGRTGRASGLVGMGLFLGFMAGPVSFGALVDATASYTVPWVGMALLALAALAITVAWRRSSPALSPSFP